MEYKCNEKCPVFGKNDYIYPRLPAGEFPRKGGNRLKLINMKNFNVLAGALLLMALISVACGKEKVESSTFDVQFEVPRL